MLCVIMDKYVQTISKTMHTAQWAETVPCRLTDWLTVCLCASLPLVLGLHRLLSIIFAISVSLFFNPYFNQTVKSFLCRVSPVTSIDAFMGWHHLRLYKKSPSTNSPTPSRRGSRERIGFVVLIESAVKLRLTPVLGFHPTLSAPERELCTHGP